MKIIRQSIIILFSLSLCMGQSSEKSGFFKNKKFGTGMGIFFNTGTDELEIDGYVEGYTRSGFFGEIWFSHLDMDQSTNIQFNPSLGYTYRLSSNLSLGTGLTIFSYFGDEVSFTEDEKDLFLGFNAGPVVVLGFWNLQQSGNEILGNLDCNYGPLTDFPVQITLMSVFGQSGSEIFLTLSKKIRSRIITGYTISSEIYESDRRRSIKNNGQFYSYNKIVKDKGIFHSVYFGYVF